LAHPLYYECLRAINKPVTLHLRNGQSHCGVLRRVTQDGVYLNPAMQPMKGQDRIELETADNRVRQDARAEQVFAPFFFPFAALAGLTLGLAAGALFARPFYPYYW
jgi:hypothetical protein